MLMAIATGVTLNGKVVMMIVKSSGCSSNIESVFCNSFVLTNVVRPKVISKVLLGGKTCHLLD